MDRRYNKGFNRVQCATLAGRDQTGVEFLHFSSCATITFSNVHRIETDSVENLPHSDMTQPKMSDFLRR